MALFSRRQEYEKTFRLRSHSGAGRGLLAFLFWLWGFLGLIFNAGSLLGLTGSVGVGTSAYLTATSLIWIGGMVLFGMGALLSHNDFDGERPLPPGSGDIHVTQ
jgi:hypothetical protein